MKFNKDILNWNDLQQHFTKQMYVLYNRLLAVFKHFALETSSVVGLVYYDFSI